jgi:hypothetical protein
MGYGGPSPSAARRTAEAAVPARRKVIFENLTDEEIPSSETADLCTSASAADRIIEALRLLSYSSTSRSVTPSLLLSPAHAAGTPTGCTRFNFPTRAQPLKSIPF